MAWFYDSKTKRKKEINHIYKPFENSDIYEVEFKGHCDKCGQREKITFDGVRRKLKDNERKALNSYIEERSTNQFNAEIRRTEKLSVKEMLTKRFTLFNKKTLRLEVVDGKTFFRKLDKEYKKIKGDI